MDTGTTQEEKAVSVRVCVCELLDLFEYLNSMRNKKGKRMNHCC